MQDVLKFEIDGDPIPLKRARGVKARDGIRFFDPNATDKAEVRNELMQQMRDRRVLRRLEGPIAVKMIFHMKIAKAHSKERKKGLPHYHKPDIDNLAKFYLDCINELIIDDDRMIAELWCKKVYSDKTKTEIFLKEL